MKNRDGNQWIVIACLLGALAVGLGAFGAHGLKPYFESRVSAEDVQARLEIWETAARYHMYHALALLALGLAAGRTASKLLRVSGWLFLAGTSVFSGCLYALSLTDIKILGAIVPIGGLSLIVAWCAFGIGMLRAKSD